jgi:hypothetical protein
MAALDDSVEVVRKDAARKKANIDWGATTVIGVIVGLLYGGSREALASTVSYHPPYY